MTCRLCDRADVMARGLCGAHYQSEKAAGRLELHPLAERVYIVRAIGGRCPRGHAHGRTSTCYNAHGCRCSRCRATKAEGRNAYDWEDRRRHGRDVWVPAMGTTRRLRALAVMGWSIASLADESGLFHRSLGKVREGSRERVHMSTYLAVAAVFERRCMTRNRTREGRITATVAAARGWLPPLAWDDIDKDVRTPLRIRQELGLPAPVGADKQIVA